MRFVAAILILTAMLAVAGCNEGWMSGVDASQYSGVIEYNKDPRIGKYAPEIVYTTLEKQRTSLSKIGHPITIIGFSDATTAMPAMLDLADRYRRQSVTVAQVFRNGGKRVVGSNLVSLSDVHGIAWNHCGKPDAGTLFLVDANRKIVVVEKVQNAVAVREYADLLAKKQEALAEEAFSQ